MLGRRKSNAARQVGAKRLVFESLENRIVLSSGSVAAHLEGPSDAQAIVAPLAASVLDLVVSSLNYTRFGELTAQQVPLLSLEQVATIPSTYWLGQMSPAARAALSTAQVRALQPASLGLSLLAAPQMAWLTTTQIAGLKYWDFPLLSPSQVTQLTPAQIATIPNASAFAAWSPAARAALGPTQVQAIDVGKINLQYLTATQVSWLTAPQIRSLPYYDFVNLQPSQISTLTPAQLSTIPNDSALGAWSQSAISQLTPLQVQSLSMPQVRINRLSSQQVGWLSVSQIQRLNFYDFIYLASGQIPQLTASQIQSIPGSYVVREWSAAARAALTPAQIPALQAADLRIDWMTAAQVGSLSVTQIRSLAYYDFVYLSPAQIPTLTAAQAASISSLSILAALPASSRAALTATQVQALPVATLGLNLLTATQSAWLTTAQIQGLKYWDFSRLVPAQVTQLTPAQIATIPFTSAFSGWSSAARWSLSATQVQALNVSAISISLLSAGQIGYLTAAQIRSLPSYDFAQLRPTQIPTLTTAQIRSISGDYVIRTWSAEARAALTQVQIQALPMPSSRIDWMTATQVGWLTSTQLSSLAYYDFAYLQPSQIPLLNPVQFAAIPTASLFGAWTDAQLAAMTRAQLLSLPVNVYAAFAHIKPEIAPPANYRPVIEAPIGPDGLNSNEHSDQEWARVLALVPFSSVTHFNLVSGNWSDPSIWNGGVVPRAGARVMIAPGTTVRFDVWMGNYAIDTLRIEGELNFAHNFGTQLQVDTIVVNTSGALHIGTAAAPIMDNAVARIVIPDNGPINTAKDPYLLGRGLLSRGEVEMFGKTVTPFVDLSVNPSAGDTKLYLAQVPINWRVGDELVVAGTDQYIAHFRTEHVRIRAISGSVVTIDPLVYNHKAPEGFGLSIQVANLTRNVVFEAENDSVIAERPHIAFMHNPNVSVYNIGVYGFGRTDKNVRLNDAVVQNGVLQPGTGLNQRARYAVHFHHTGVNPAVDPAVIRGSVVVGSPGWGYVNHQSNVAMENNVAIDVVGAAFATEDGNEIGMMRANLAINSTGSSLEGDRGDIHDFGFAGHGFWLQGPGVAVIGNISAGSKSAGFYILTASSKAQFDAVNLSDPAMAAGRSVVPVGSVPLKAFDGNTAYASGEGMALWKNMLFMTDGQTVINRFTSWNSRDEGITLAYSGHVLVQDAMLIGDLQNFSGVGISTNRLVHDVTINNLIAVGFQVGVVAPVRRSTTISGGYIGAVEGVYVAKGQDTIRTVNVRGTSFIDLTPAQLRGRSQYDVFSSPQSMDPVIDRSLASLFASDYIVISPPGAVAGRLYFYEQASNFVPFAAGTSVGLVPDEYLNKTNQQLSNEFGISFGGQISPDKVSQLPDIYGLMRYRF